ncbi:hypothetical protein [Parablautia muri]|uniref:Uncharacterized protein n=1 Tax=Parablautia muri TaxID=2320879 RepID=A0A9X5BCB1_9FIRM|nr:hypothetical protein [Parablautia muri]NBJ91384.1 hypothetical protein [Parablautia muri]
MQKVKIDSREFRLGKWNIPRNEKADYPIGDMYYALGYFDILGIEKIKESEHHLLTQAYESSYRRKEVFQSDFFVQEIKAFTNISKNPEVGFEAEQIKDFWEDDSILLCFSMLQLYLKNDVESILRKIREVFTSVKYLYYFTFDYSGIVILAKNISIKDYMELLFKINYSNKKDVKLVKDTFSIYGLRKENLKAIFEKFSENQWSKENVLKYLNDKEEYEIVVNISVQNYSAYKFLEKDLHDFEKKYGYTSESFKLSGRHDISVVNRKTDMGWLLFIQYLLNLYTGKSVGDFYAYESFIKVGLKEEYPDQKSDFKIYDPLVNRIKNAQEEFVEKAKECGYDSYCIPVKEVSASIISLLHNGFAEDFVICIYQPFIEFLEYLHSKMEEQIENEKANIQYSEAFDKCFCSYYDGLNALVNSAMHADRQFIRATSFSNIFYDVPPKIMAFYVAIIYKTMGIMQTSGEKKYTFFMSPSFSDEVNVKIISYDEVEMPCDRLLKVSINERSLYNPKAVIRRMTHEIAHFVGGPLRKRSLRMEKIIDTIVYIILRQTLYIDFKLDSSFINLKKKIVTNIINDYGINCESKNYSNDLKELYRQIIRYMTHSETTVHEEIRKYVFQKIEDLLREGKYTYFSKIIERENESNGCGVIDSFHSELQLTLIQKEYLSKLILKDIVREMSILSGEKSSKSIVNSMGNTILRGDKPLKKYIRGLISLYSETYSDLQMILLLKISYEDYLNGFIDDEKIDVYSLKKNNEDISRIAVTSQLMQEKEKWESELAPKMPEKTKLLHTYIKEFQAETKYDGNPYKAQNQNLKEYLKACLELSEEYYEKKQADILELREVLHTLVKYEDAKRVYSTICSVISKYCETLEI